MTSGWKLSEETKARMREAWTPERRIGHSNRQTGRLLTPETKMRIALSMIETWKRKKDAKAAQV